MNDFLKRNLQFVIMLLAWVAAGMVAIPAGIGIVALSVILLKRKDMYAEMIVGFIFILVLSDSRQDQLEFAKKVKDIYLLLLTVFYIFDRKQFSFKNNIIVAFIPFLIWSFGVAFRGPDLVVSIQKTLSYGLLYFIVPSFFIKAFRMQVAQFVKDFVFLIVFLNLLGFGLIFFKPDFVFLAGRYNGILGNPNGMGMFTALVIILTVCANIKFPDLFSKNNLIVIFVITGLSVLLTGSRNSLMCIIIFLIFTKFYKISYWYGFMAVIVSILLYQVVFANLPTLLEALGLAKALRAENLESGSGRIVAWLFALNKLNSNAPLFIFGGGFSYDEFIYYANRHVLSALGHQGGVHNSFLALWLNTGIVGLILWGVGFFRTFFRAIPLAYTALPLLYMVLFSAFFEAWLMGSLNPYHITFILILAFLTTDSKDFAVEEKPEESLFPELKTA